MSDEAQAKHRFILLNLVRLGGLMMVLAGIAAHQGALPLPQPIGLMLAGLLLMVLAGAMAAIASMARRTGRVSGRIGKRQRRHDFNRLP